MKPTILTLLISAFCITAFAQVSDKEWQAKAVEKYPALGVQGSELNERFLSVVAERRKIAPSFFTNPKWPLILADELAITSPAAAPPQTPERTAQPAELRFPKSQPINSDPLPVSNLPEQTGPSTPLPVIQPAQRGKAPPRRGLILIALFATVGVTILVAVANNKHSKVAAWNELSVFDRGKCMRMAWLGYEPQSDLPAIMILLVSLVSGLTAFNVSGDAENILFSCSAIMLPVSIYSFWRARQINRALAQKQRLGLDFLNSKYPPLVGRWKSEYDAWVISRLNDPTAVHTHWTELPLHPVRRVGIGAAIFHRPQKEGAVAYGLKSRGLAIRPASAAKTEEKDILSKIKKAVKGLSSPKDEVNWFKALGELANGSDPSFQLMSQAHETAEFFFDEMINLIDGTAGATITLRDNRSLNVLAPSEFLAALRKGLRARKSTHTESVATQIPNSPGGSSKTCPMCAETIKAEAQICRFCQHRFI